MSFFIHHERECYSEIAPPPNLLKNRDVVMRETPLQAKVYNMTFGVIICFCGIMYLSGRTCPSKMCKQEKNVTLWENVS